MCLDALLCGHVSTEGAASMTSQWCTLLAVAKCPAGDFVPCGAYVHSCNTIRISCPQAAMHLLTVPVLVSTYTCSSESAPLPGAGSAQFTESGDAAHSSAEHSYNGTTQQL